MVILKKDGKQVGVLDERTLTLKTRDPQLRAAITEAVEVGMPKWVAPETPDPYPGPLIDRIEIVKLKPNDPDLLIELKRFLVKFGFTAGRGK